MPRDSTEAIRHEHAPAWCAVYDAATLAATAIGAPLAALGGLARPAWREGLLERLGSAPRVPGEPAWFQAASVGEVRAFAPLARELRRDLPALPLVLSVTTEGGHVAARSLDALLAAPPFRLPLDAPPTVRRALSRMGPRLLATVETEIWPNLIHACAGAGVPVAIVNGRISRKSFGRYGLARALFRDALSLVDVLAMRTEEDAERVLALGAPPGRVTVTGNLKFDAAEATPAEPAVPWAARAGLAQPPWIVFASTAEDEEAIALDAFRQLLRAAPGARALLAPRRVERSDDVARLAAARGFHVLRRSVAGAAWDAPPVPPGGVLLLDTLGELARLYRHAELVFVGGSIAPRSGHNLLEPAAAARPVLFGPNVADHRDAADALLGAQAGVQVVESTLAGELVRLMSDEPERSRMGARAREVVRANAGAARRTVELLAPLLPAAGRRPTARSASRRASSPAAGADPGRAAT